MDQAALAAAFFARRAQRAGADHGLLRELAFQCSVEPEPGRQDPALREIPAMLDALARMVGGLMKAWMDGCALHARSTLGYTPDMAD